MSRAVLGSVELEELVDLLGLPEPEVAAGIASRGRDQEAGQGETVVPRPSPGHFPWAGAAVIPCPVCQSKTRTAGLLTAPSGLVASIRPPQARYLPSQLSDEIAHAAVIDPLPGRVVLVELARVEPPRLLAGTVVPFDHPAAEIGRDQACGRRG